MNDGREPLLPAPSLSHVLVVGHSQITRVVVARIIERVGLKPIEAAPDAAAGRLRSLFPGTVVLDGGADNRDCDHLLEDILALRRLSQSRAPCVILLSTRNGTPESLSLSSTIDAVVAKPITPERLQPVVLKLLNRARG